MAYQECQGEHPCLHAMGKREDIHSRIQPDRLVVGVGVPVAAMEPHQEHHRIHHRELACRIQIQSSDLRLVHVCHHGRRGRHGRHAHRQPMGQQIRDRGGNRRAGGRRVVVVVVAKERDHQLGHAAMASNRAQGGHLRGLLRCGEALHRPQGHLQKVLA